MARGGRVIGVAAALGVAFVAGWAMPRPLLSAPQYAPMLQPRTVAARGELAQLELATIALFEATSPSVVQVVARTRLFPGMQEAAVGSGTGWIWDSSGHIVTNHHVVAQSQEVGVRFSDGELVPARVIGRAPQYDLAVLQLETPTQAAPLALGSSEDLRVGQAVFAIGNPFGLEGSLTSGIVSALNRNLPTQNGREILDVIQTDAAINPGNSGGPLLDSAGRVVGVNTAIFSPSGAYAGVGFAVPVDTVLRVVPLLISDGRAPTPGIGVQIANEATAARLGAEGLLIWHAPRGGPADRVGLRGTDPQSGILGDVIVEVDGRPVRSVTDLTSAIERRGVGNEVGLTIQRGTERIAVSVPIEDIGVR